jgi:hypothetical protein
LQFDADLIINILFEPLIKICLRLNFLVQYPYLCNPKIKKADLVAQLVEHPDFIGRAHRELRKKSSGLK